MKRVIFLPLLVASSIFFARPVNAQPLDSQQMIYDSLDVQYYPTGLLHNRSLFYWFSKDSGYYASPYLFDGSIPAKKCFKKTFSQFYL